MSNTTVTDRPETANLFDPTFRIQVGAIGTATIWPERTVNDHPIIAVDFADEGGIKSLSPAEALALAAALQAVATFQLEEPRELHRNTEPGQPQAEELQGVGL